jgi:hypothetical protein
VPAENMIAWYYKDEALKGQKPVIIVLIEGEDGHKK